MRYPVELTPDDNDTIMVTFPDVPGAVTYGDGRADALARAVDALETMLGAYITGRRDLPVPSPAEGRPLVATSLLAALKLTLYRAMRERGWRKADFARVMGHSPRRVDRLLDLRHASTVAQLDHAIAACDHHFTVALTENEAVATRPAVRPLRPPDPSPSLPVVAPARPGP